jgi:uncharacterized protein with von Willebrand factor type A (vWA) domain
MTYLELLRHIADESAYAVDSSEYSRREWIKAKEAAPDLKSLQSQGEVTLPNFADLQCDSYHTFYQSKPLMKDADELADKAVASRHIVNHMQSLEEYKRLHGYTQHNQPAATVAVRKVNQIVDDLPDDVKGKIGEQQTLANELDEAEQELETLRDMWRELDEQEEQNDADDDADESEDDRDEEDQDEGDRGEDGQGGDESGDSGEGCEGGSGNDASGEQGGGSGESGSGGGATQTGSGPSKSDLERRGQECSERVEKLSAQVSEATQELNDAFDQNEDEVRAAVRHACAEGVDEAEEMQEAVEAFGCGSGPGGNEKVSFEDQMEIARMMRGNEELRQIAEMAGRIERIIKNTKQDVVASMGGGSIVDVELTGDLSKLLPSEMMRMAHPTTKRELMLRLAEKKALGWKKERKDKVGKGPIICCVDSSGSMSTGAYSSHYVQSHTRTDQWGYEQIVDGHYRYRSTPETAIVWAKAVALSLYRECADRGVPFIYVHFSSGGRVDVRRFDAKPGEELEFMRFSQIFHAGGTDYRLALNACLEQFEEDGMEKSDVVFISDGEYPRDEEMGREFKAKMDELGGKTLGVQIGGYESERPFGDFADASWMLSMNNLRDNGNDVPVLKEMFTDFL